MTYDDLGKLVKQKYPGSYDNVGNEELGKKTAEKYPTYQSQVTQDQPAVQIQPRSNLFEKIADFIGPGKLARGLSQVIMTPQAIRQSDRTRQENEFQTGKILQAMRQAKTGGETGKYDRLKQLLLNQPEQSTVEQLATEGKGFVTPKETIGSAIRTATLLPMIGLKTAGTLAGRSLQAGSIGIASGLGTGLETGKDSKDVAKSAAISGLTGFAIPPAIEGIQKFAAGRAANLYNSIFGITKNEAKKAVQYGTETIGQKVVKKGGLPGFAKTREGILNLTEKGINQTENQIQPILKNIKGIVTFDDISQPLVDMRNQYAQIPGEESAVKVIDRVLKTTKNTFGKKGLNAIQANGIKRKLYEAIGKAFEKPEAERAIVGQAQTELARGIRKSLEGLDPTQKIAGINAEQGYHLVLRNKILEGIAKNQIKTAADAARIVGNLFRPGNLVRDIGAGGLGYLAGGLPGGIGLILGEQAIRSAPAVTARAKLASLVANTARRPEATALLERLLAGIKK